MTFQMSMSNITWFQRCFLYVQQKPIVNSSPVSANEPSFSSWVSLSVPAETSTAWGDIQCLQGRGQKSHGFNTSFLPLSLHCESLLLPLCNYQKEHTAGHKRQLHYIRPVKLTLQVFALYPLALRSPGLLYILCAGHYGFALHYPSQSMLIAA